jgi:hypothetical protein
MTFDLKLINCEQISISVEFRCSQRCITKIAISWYVTPCNPALSPPRFRKYELPPSSGSQNEDAGNKHIFDVMKVNYRKKKGKAMPVTDRGGP